MPAMIDVEIVLRMIGRHFPGWSSWSWRVEDAAPKDRYISASRGAMRSRNAHSVPEWGGVIGSRRCGERWRACRRTPVSGRLLVGVTDLEQCRLAPGSPEDLEAGRQGPARESHRDGDRRKPGRRRNPRAVVAVRGSEIADQSRRVVPRRINEHVEP